MTGVMTQNTGLPILSVAQLGFKVMIEGEMVLVWTGPRLAMAVFSWGRVAQNR